MYFYGKIYSHTKNCQEILITTLFPIFFGSTCIYFFPDIIKIQYLAWYPVSWYPAARYLFNSASGKFLLFSLPLLWTICPCYCTNPSPFPKYKTKKSLFFQFSDFFSIAYGPLPFFKSLKCIKNLIFTLKLKQFLA